MNQYIKDGMIYGNVPSIILNGKQIINPKENQILAAGYEIYLEPEESDGAKLENAIMNKVCQSDDYADSDDLNSYIAQGVVIRLPLELRLRLRNVIDAKMSLGETMLTEWYDGVNYTYPLSAWDVQLAQYENYLYEVMCNSERHRQAIRSLTDIDEVDEYDYTTGYPEQLDFGSYE